LWITSEDNSPYLGCYGDSLAHTPNLDRLASEGVRFTHAFANAPVCSSARSTLITGMYSMSLGIHHHRSGHPVPEAFKPYPIYLRQAGYTCTNNHKKDYNLIDDFNCWHESSRTAHYKDRDPGVPFFAVFNLGESHESSTFPEVVEKRRQSGAYPRKSRVRPEEIRLPPYHPDLPEIRQEWADYYDAVTLMDRKAGAILKELEASGEAENTIVFYFSDHGGGLARGKRFVYDTGTRVPMIIRFPEKWKHLAPAEPGATVDRMVGFVDLPATLLSLVGAPIPAHMHGRPFLGDQAGEPRTQVLLYRGRMDSRYDIVRAVRDKRYRYIRNYSPHRPYGQPYTYAQNSRTTPAWRKAYREGKCSPIQSIYWEMKPGEELYDCENDPWEVDNLAADPQHAGRLAAMRRTLHRELLEVGDTGFVPEAMFDLLAGGKTIYDFIRSDACELPRVKAMADRATSRDVAHLMALIQGMEDPNPLIRYWAAIGAVVLREKAALARDRLTRLLKDDVPNVRIAAAEALGLMGDPKTAVEALAGELDYERSKVEAHYVYAANALQYLDESSVRILKPRLKEIAEDERYGNACRTAGYLVEHLESLGY
jgi:arylsulfatase A-like enzyme